MNGKRKSPSSPFPKDVELSNLERKAYHRRLSIRQDKPMIRTDTSTAIIAPPDFRLTPSKYRSSEELSAVSEDVTKSTYLEYQGNLTPGLPSNISWSQDVSDEEPTDDHVLLLKMMKRQDTNACIIAPPNYKIESNEGSQRGEFKDKEVGCSRNDVEVDGHQKGPIYKRYLVPITRIRERFYKNKKVVKEEDVSNYV